MLRRVVLFFVSGLAVVPALPALASPEGEVAAALVSKENYRHILDDMLYTHAGDDRGFGPEHDLAMLNVVALFEDFGLTVTLEPFVYPYPEPDSIYYNLVGTKLGNTNPDKEYVIGAHYDSVNNPGADDNGSGVSLVLEAARVLSAYESDYTIRFVAFDREEQGVWGSEAYVFDHSFDDIVGMISADMVAYNDDDANSVDIFARSASVPLQVNLAAAVAEYGDGLAWQEWGYSPFSDHAPFEDAGIQAVLLIEDRGNPFYHTQRDNVDEPDYIDYAYATRVTRSVVGFLVDNAGVHVDIPDADYDGDGDVDQDDFDVFSTCYSGSGNPPDPGCEFFDFDGDDDVDCDDWRVFEVLWTGPGDPPTFEPCPTCFMSSPAQPETLALAGNPVSQKVRYLSFSAGDVSGTPGVGRSQAVRISFKNLPPPYDTWNEVEMWVQKPTTYCENSGKKLPPCPSAQPTTDFLGATLGCDPRWGDFDSAGVIHVFHEGIVPGGTYWIEVVDATCDWANKPWSSFSAPLVLAQSVWGDLVRNCVTCPCGPPDGIVNMTSDVTAVLDKFRNLEPPEVNCASVTKARADLDWETPDQLINISDATCCLDAFRGFQYPPESFPPPSSPPCGG